MSRNSGGFQKISKIIVFSYRISNSTQKSCEKTTFPKSPISNRKVILVIFQKIPFFRLFFVQIYTLKKNFFLVVFLEFFCSKKLFLGMSRNFDQFFIFLKKMCFQSGEDKIFFFTKKKSNLQDMKGGWKFFTFFGSRFWNY